MDARQDYKRFPTQTLLVVIGLALALLLSGVAGYALHGLVAQCASLSETVTKDQVPDWMRQGTGPTDADAQVSLPAELTAPTGPTDQDALLAVST